MSGRAGNQKRLQSSTNQKDSGAASAPAMMLRNTYDAVTAKENQSVVRGMAMFGVSLALYGDELYHEISF